MCSGYGAALDTATECQSKMKQVDGQDQPACDYTAEVGYVTTLI